MILGERHNSKAPLHPNENERLRSLQSTQLLDSEPSIRFDAITELARTVFNVPIALVSLVALVAFVDVCSRGRCESPLVASGFMSLSPSTGGAIACVYVPLGSRFPLPHGSAVATGCFTGAAVNLPEALVVFFDVCSRDARLPDFVRDCFVFGPPPSP